MKAIGNGHDFLTIVTQVFINKTEKIKEADMDRYVFEENAVYLI